jgi:hypothetical protein
VKPKYEAYRTTDASIKCKSLERLSERVFGIPIRRGEKVGHIFSIVKIKFLGISGVSPSPRKNKLIIFMLEEKHLNGIF